MTSRAIVMLDKTSAETLANLVGGQGFSTDEFLTGVSFDEVIMLGSPQEDIRFEDVVNWSSRADHRFRMISV